MSTAFNQIFWGYLMIMIDIRIGSLDLIADPIGYAIILAGLTTLIGQISFDDKSRTFARLLIYLSIPSMFIDPNHLGFFSGWSVYFLALSILDLVMVYYIFRLIIEFNGRFGNVIIIDRTDTIFTLYMLINIIALVLGPILTAIPILFFTIAIASLVMDIAFLVLVREVRSVI